MAQDKQALPLDGITVVDLSRVLAGPYFTLILAIGCSGDQGRDAWQWDDSRAFGLSSTASRSTDLLSKVEGIEFLKPARPDECCGFGGTFCVFEELVSSMMGYDMVSDHARAGAEYIVPPTCRA